MRPLLVTWSLIVVGTVALGMPIGALAVTVTVDLATQEGTMSHRANGYLVSVEPDRPPTDLIEPLRPTSFRGSAGYVLPNYDRLQRIGVDEFQLTLGLIFGDLATGIFDINRIGEDGDYGPWLAHVEHIVDQVAAQNRVVWWDIYNEPDRADLPIGQNDRLKEGWRLAYRLIKQRLPGAVIVGPSVAYYSALRPFLEWSRAAEVFPDVVAYHEYADPAEAGTYVADLRAYLAAIEMPRPISVNEILGQDFWMIPGYVAGALATYERLGIVSAMHACWPDAQDASRLQLENTCINPTLDGLLYLDRQSKRPGWHVYKSYADMQGTRMSAVSESERTHVLASADGAARSLQLLLGKYDEPATEATRVVVRNLSQSAIFGGARRLRVRAERIADVGSAPLELLPVMIDRCVPVQADDFEFLLAEFSRRDAYWVEITPCSVPVDGEPFTPSQ